MRIRPLLFLLLTGALTGCWASHPQPPADPEGLGYPDADLPLFAPGHAGMVFTSRNYDAHGELVGQEIEELEEASEPSGPKTRRYKVTEDPESGASQVSTVTFSIYPDRIESRSTESERLKVLLRTPLRPGTTWTYARGPGAGEERRTILGIEDVCTRWGFFPRAIKVEGTLLGPLARGGEPVRTRTQEWFARGVGRVQVVARVENKPGLELRSVLEDVIDPGADTPLSPPSCRPGPAS